MLRAVGLALFLRRLTIESVGADGVATPCPLKAIDSFCMRNFTNDAVFDDTLPVADGLLEAGLRVPLDLLEERMTDWFRRKRYLGEGEVLRVTEVARSVAQDIPNDVAPGPTERCGSRAH